MDEALLEPPAQAEEDVEQLDALYADHLERVASQVFDRFNLAKVPEWICERTRRENLPFSFVDHEYQLKILQSTAREKVVKKCSQVGITELCVRETLAVMDILGEIQAIYTLPTSKDAKMVSKTRFDVVIEQSDYLRARTPHDGNAVDLKKIGNAYLHLKGTIGQTAAISVPASLLVHDEVDFSDQEVLTKYQSRLTHSRYKLKRKLSTPTVAGYGIDEEFRKSNRHFNFVRCHHCQHFFLPDYFEHVKIPGYDGDLRQITKFTIHNVRHEEAWFCCPRCGKSPSLGPAHRQWVVENPDEAHVADGFQVSPFDAPAIIKPGDLVWSSSTYDRYVDFINFNLGQCASDKENALTREELEKLWVPGEAPRFPYYVVGIDAGLTMHITISGVTYDGILAIVRLKRVSVGNFLEEMQRLAAEFFMHNGVMDSQPYFDLLNRVQEWHSSIFGAIYVRSKMPEAFMVRAQEEEKEAARQALHMVSINRNRALDQLLGEIRAGKVIVYGNGNEEEKEAWLTHLTDMKRVQKVDVDEELHFEWIKSKKKMDHYHHSLNYCAIAAKMRGFGEMRTPYGFYLQTFKNRTLQSA